MTVHRWLQDLLADHASHADVVGASVAIFDDGDITTGVYGDANRRTATPVITSTAFQVGSITKPYVATVVMQLVARGLADFDRPVIEYLPTFAMDDPRASSITLRHLLTHTSGIPGDHFPELGRGDDAVARYVDSLRGFSLEDDPGQWVSYSNAGYVVAGAVIERITGTTWDSHLRSSLLAPIGVRSSTLPEELVLDSVAIGHFEDGTGRHSATRQYSLPRSAGPAGTTLSATASDVVQFAALHLGPGAPRVLDASSIRLLQRPQVELRTSLFGTHRSLAWVLDLSGSRPVFGHDGTTIGQAAFLRVLPEHKSAVALLTNSELGGARLASSLLPAIFGRAWNASYPKPPLAKAEPVDLRPYLGRYKRYGFEVSIRYDGAGLRANTVELEATGDRREQSFDLRPVGGGRFLIGAPNAVPRIVAFFEDRDGECRRYSDGRVSTRA